MTLANTSASFRCFVRVGLRQIVENIIEQQNRVAQAGALYQMVQQTEQSSGGGYSAATSRNPLQSMNTLLERITVLHNHNSLTDLKTLQGAAYCKYA